MFPLTALIYGALSALAAFLLESLFLAGVPLGPMILLAGALIEESAKLLFLFQWQKRFQDQVPPLLPLQLLLCVFFGIGFASVEIAIALPPHLSTILSLASVHALTSLPLGYAIMRKGGSPRALLLCLGLATCLHTAYNLFAPSLQ